MKPIDEAAKPVDEAMLLRAVGDVGDDLVERAAHVRSAPRMHIGKWIAAAACLALMCLPLFYLPVPVSNESAPPALDESASPESEAGGPNNVWTGDIPAGGDSTDRGNGGAVASGETESASDEVQKSESTDRGGAVYDNTAVKASEEVDGAWIGADAEAVRVTYDTPSGVQSATVRGEALERLRDWTARAVETAVPYPSAVDVALTEDSGLYGFSDENGAERFYYYWNDAQGRYLYRVADGQWYTTTAGPPPTEGMVFQ